MEGRCGTRYYFPRDAPPFSVTYGGYSSGGRRQPRHVISSDGRFKDAHETYGPLVTIFHDRGVSLDFLLRQRDVFEKCPVKCTAPKSRRRRKQTDLLGRRNRMGKRDIASQLVLSQGFWSRTHNLRIIILVLWKFIVLIVLMMYNIIHSKLTITEKAYCKRGYNFHF